MKIKNILVIASIALVIIACKEESKYNVIKNNSSKEVGNIKKAVNEKHKVVALESLDAGSYTYVKVSEGDNEYWVAVPQAKIEIGKTYYYNGGLEMVDFKSSELDRIFDKVLFLENFRSDEVKENTKTVNEAVHQKKEIENKVEIVIEKPKGGTSIKDLFTNVKAFSDKEIIVKGKVVKVNRNILEKNWVHVQDGTNFEGKSSLTITTIDSVNVGDIVTFKGVITLNKDFGQGYVYPVLMEKGQIQN